MMDNRHFDALTRAFAGISRRSALAATAAAIAGLVSGQGADAGRRDRKFRRRMKRRHRRLKRQVRNIQPADAQQTCASSNGCDGILCPSGGSGCYCRISASTGESICAGGAYLVLHCANCLPTEVCVDLSACGGAGAVGCAVPCP
jgi:hypothetical protein